MSWEHGKIASIMGKWAWIVAIIAGIVDMLWAIFNIVTSVSLFGPFAYISSPFQIVNIVFSIILIIFAIVIIKPRFSDKCAEKDWDYLLEDVMHLGSIRFPKMLVWAILASLFGLGWAGVLIVVPAMLLLFAGPKPYNWKK